MQRKKWEEKIRSGRADSSLKIYLRVGYFGKIGESYDKDAY